MKLGRNNNLQTEVTHQCYQFLDSSDDGGSTARIKTFLFQQSVLLKV